MTEESTDEELMQMYQEGNSQAFDILYSRYKQAVYSFMRKQIYNQDICDELFQDAWLKLIHSRHQYRNTGSFKAYLFQIIRNRLVDYYRSDKSRHLDQDGFHVDDYSRFNCAF